MGMMTQRKTPKAAVRKPARTKLGPGEAERRQRAYAAHRRDWAEAVGRPYQGKEDPRPPPGEIDIDAAEE
jgi:hypothetical protein